MSASRDRKEAARKLGIALGIQHRRLVEASGDEAISAAAVNLGQTFNDNIEFIVWVLKEFGGVPQMPIERNKAPPRLLVN